MKVKTNVKAGNNQAKKWSRVRSPAFSLTAKYFPAMMNSGDHSRLIW